MFCMHTEVLYALNTSMAVTSGQQVAPRLRCHQSVQHVTYKSSEAVKRAGGGKKHDILNIQPNITFCCHNVSF